MTLFFIEMDFFSFLRNWKGNKDKERGERIRATVFYPLLGNTIHTRPGQRDWKAQERKKKDAGALTKSHIGAFLHVSRSAVRGFNAAS